jgi:hypothetical protein
MPEKQQILADAKESNILDNNFYSYLDITAREFLLRVGENTYELSPDGEKELEFILNEMNDKSKEGFPYWQGASKVGVKTGSISKEEQHFLDNWVKQEVDIGKIQVKDLKSPMQGAMFAIWSITKLLKVAPAVKPKIAFSYLTKRYTTVSFSLKSFTDVLGRSYNSHLFKKNQDGLYYLTREAEEQVSSWIETGVPIGEKVNSKVR